MYIQDLFNPNQKEKLKGNELFDNSKNLNSEFVKDKKIQLLLTKQKIPK